MAKEKMKILKYPVVFSHTKDGGYNVSFPDFPGCVTFGRTFEEAKEKAGEVLVLWWLEDLANAKKDIPVHCRDKTLTV